MAKNPPPGPGRRGAVTSRSQFVGPGGQYVTRDAKTGRIMDVKADKAPFKGVRKEKWTAEREGQLSLRTCWPPAR